MKEIIVQAETVYDTHQNFFININLNLAPKLQ